MSRGGGSWRTGSPDRLNQMLENRAWDPSQMFGARRRDPPAAPPAPAAAPPPRAPPPPQPAAKPPAPQAGGFTTPAWCVLPRQPCTTRLAVHRGSDLVDVVPLGLKSSFVTGRSPEVDIVLEHPSASRRHAMVLHHRSGAVYLLDLGSAHGTFLGGKRLTHHEPTVWAEGVRCVFGASSRAYVLLVTPPSSALPHPPAAPVVAAEAETARAAVREAQVAPPPRAPAEAQPVDPGLARREATAAVVALAASTVAAGGGGAAAERGAEADAEGSGDEYLLDDECEENTRRNTAVAVRPEPRKEQQPWQQRRRVRFGAAPQLHYFEVRSPEPIDDPEAATHAASAATAATAAAAAAAPVKSAGPARVTADVTTTRVAATSAAGVGATDGGGLFGALSSVTLVPSATAGARAAARAAADEAGGEADSEAGGGGSGAADALKQKLQAMYGEAEAEESTSPKKVFAKERWFPARKRARTEAAAAAAAPPPPPPPFVWLEAHTAHTAVEWLESEGATVTLGGASGTPLLRLVFGRAATEDEGRMHTEAECTALAEGACALEDASLNPLSEGPRAVASYYVIEPTAAAAAATAAAPRRGSAPASWRALPSEPPPPLRISVVNLQSRPVFVHLSLLPPGAVAPARALTPWSDLPAEECPVPLSLPPPARGANCLLLAPYEGLPHCTADEAERAPFGESNTFSFVAATHLTHITPLQLDAPADLRIEAGFQLGDGDAAPGTLSLLGEAYDDAAAPEAPFCVATFPLRQDEPSQRTSAVV